MGDNVEENNGQVADNGITAAEILQQSEGFQQQTQEETLETSSEEQVEKVEKQEPEENKLFASKFAALSRKEKALREREAEVESRMAQIEARFKELENANKPAPAPEEEPFETAFKKNPLEAMKRYGYDYETLTQIALNDGKLTPELQMRLMQEQLDSKYGGELEKLKAQLEEKEQKAEQNRHTQVIENFKGQINSEISANAAEYELLSIEGDDGVGLVYDVIEEYYNKNGEVMNVKEAAGLVEDYLLDEAKKRIGLSKIQKLVGASKPATEAKPEPRQTESVTLSNNQSQTSQTGERFLSDDESKRKVARLIRWTE